MAAFSGEKVLCDAYCANEGVHKKTAAAVFDIDVDAVTKSQRQVGKTINFALLYGMGAQKLARETGYSTKEAKVFLDKFKAQFPTLTAWFAKTLDAARQSGETRTLFGHRRVMPELFSTQPVVQAAGERIAQNAPVQGGASDVVKMAMIRLDRAMAENGLQAKLLIQVHDELLVECPDDEVPRVSALLREAMEGAAALAVPLVVALKVGKSWADMA
jgi:DNA polymerase-1